MPQTQKNFAEKNEEKIFFPLLQELCFIFASKIDVLRMIWSLLSPPYWRWIVEELLLNNGILLFNQRLYYLQQLLFTNDKEQHLQQNMLSAIEKLG